MHIRYLLFFLAFMVSGWLPAIARDNTIKLTGFVMDSNKRAIELVNVFEQNTQQGTASDQSGYYELELPWQDTLILYYSCLSYQAAVRIVPVEVNQLVLNVTMTTSSKTLDEAVVTGQQRRTGSLEKVDISDIRLLPDPTGGSIEALLVTFAGVSSNNELSSQYSVRGGNYDENLVYVNGMEVYRPLLIRSGQQEGLSFVNPQMTDEVKFSAGGFEAMYGDKMASVLDIRYKKPEEFEGSAALSLLGANVFLGQASKNGKFRQIHGMRYKTNAYLLGTLDTEAEYRPSFLDYQTYMTYSLAPKWELSFLGNFSQNNYHFVPETRKTKYGVFNNQYEFYVYFEGKEKDLFRTAFGALSLEHKAHRNLSLSLSTSLFRTDEEENYDITGEYYLSDTPIKNNQADTANTTILGTGLFHEHARNQLTAKVLNVSHRGEWRLQRHEIKWGLGWQLEDIDDRLREWELRDSAGYSLPYSDRQILLTNNLLSKVQMNSHRFTAYLQDSWKTRIKGGLFTINGGLRYNYWTFNRELLLSPRVSMSFLPAWEKDFSFRLSGGLYYQAPFYKELRDTVTTNGLSEVVLNHSIKAQRSWQVVLGMDYHFVAWDRPFKLTSEAYYKDLKNIIPYTVDNVRIRYYGENMAYGHAAGLDFKLFGEFVPGTDSWISLSLMDSKETIGDYTVARPNEQRYNVSLYFRDYLPRNPSYSMSLKLVWADGLSFGPPSMDRSYATLRMSPYWRVDIGFSRVLNRTRDAFMNKGIFRHFENIWIGLDCFNLFGINNTNSYYWITDVAGQQWAIPNYLTGRQLNVSLSMDF